MAPPNGNNPEAEELDEELEEELDDSWEDDGSESPGAKILRGIVQFRARAIVYLATLAVFSLIAFCFCSQIFDVLLQPLCKAMPPLPPSALTGGGGANVNPVATVFGSCGLYPIDPLEVILVFFKLSLLVGFMASLPVLLWQIYKLAGKRVGTATKLSILVFIAAATVFFVGGAAFGYFLVFPQAFRYLLSIGGANIHPMPTAQSYFEIISMLLLGFGVSFELPLVMFLLSKLGVTGPRFYLKYWRHAIFGLAVFSAVVTPTTDPLTMTMMAAPLAGLYFLGIGLSAFARHNGPTLFEQRRKELEAFLADGESEDDEDLNDDGDDSDEEPSEAAGA